MPWHPARAAAHDIPAHNPESEAIPHTYSHVRPVVVPWPVEDFAHAQSLSVYPHDKRQQSTRARYNTPSLNPLFGEQGRGWHGVPGRQNKSRIRINPAANKKYDAIMTSCLFHSAKRRSLSSRAFCAAIFSVLFRLIYAIQARLNSSARIGGGLMGAPHTRVQPEQLCEPLLYASPS